MNERMVKRRVALAETGDGVKGVIYCCHYQERQYLTAKQVMKVAIVPYVRAKSKGIYVFSPVLRHTDTTVTGAV